MTPQDIDLIENLTSSHPELQRLVEEHRDYEARLDDLARRRWLSPDEQGEQARLKRLKLRGRDRIESILAPHRRQASLRSAAAAGTGVAAARA